MNTKIKFFLFFSFFYKKNILSSSEETVPKNNKNVFIVSDEMFATINELSRILNLLDLDNKDDKNKKNAIQKYYIEKEKLAKAEREASEQTRIYYQNQSSIFWKLIVEYLLRTIIAVGVTSLLNEIIDFFKKSIKTRQLILDTEKNCDLLINSHSIVNLTLNTNQQKQLDMFTNILIDTIKYNTTPSSFFLVLCGEPGTGKTTIMLNLAKISNFYIKNSSKNLSKILNNILPKGMKNFLLYFNFIINDGILHIWLSGAQFYNFGQEESASILSKFFDFFIYLINKKKMIIMLYIDEGELFLTGNNTVIIKSKLTEIHKIHQNPNKGKIFILLSTNNAEKIDDSLARRFVIMSFNSPQASQILNSTINYFKKHISEDKMTSIILKYPKIWMPFTAGLSHSDIENIVWSLSIEIKQKNIILNIEVLLYFILEEIKKRQIIIEKIPVNQVSCPELELLLEEINIEIENIFNCILPKEYVVPKNLSVECSNLLKTYFFL